MKIKLNFSIVLALLFVLFAIKPDTAHAEDTPLASVEYTSHVTTKGWLSYVNSGTSGTLSTENQMEAFRIKLNNQDYTGDIQYEAHVTNNGWMGAVKNDTIAGTTGNNLAIQAIKIQLTGEMANHYDIYYRANVSTMGWLGWAKNNELAGGTGFSLPMLGYEVKLIRKGDPTPEVKENYPSYLVNDFTAKIANINNANGTYDVIVDTKTSPVKEVKIPTWTANNGGDDIVWHVATKQSDGTYKYTVKSSEHKYESGTYSTHVYMYSSAGQADRSMALPDVELKPEVKSKITTDTKNIYITITGADPYKLTPTAAVWSDKNGQDDLKWYNGTSIKVPISSHSGYGNYRVDVYYSGINNALIGVSTNTIKTSENAVNLLDEGKWFPYNQKLQIFKDSDISKNKLEAIEFLKILSGKEHKVITGIAIITADECIVDYEETIVTFRTLTEDEIIRYVETEEPLDKAGAYGIQGIGAIFVEKICGCYSNVVGLPLSKLYKICHEAGIKLL